MTAAMASTQLARELCSVAAITHVIHRREISAVELAQVSLDRAERDAKELGSFTIVLHERALAQAQRVDARVAVGAVLPLAGVPVSVKDAIWLAGVPATNGSKAFESFVPTESSASIYRLEQAGAVVVGKTNNPEFCLFGYTDGPLLGPARNPYDRERTAGGSSGGAAASVASRATPVALGSDGGGSIRGPASFCGTFGLKPSFGLVPNQPALRIWPSLSVDGPIARSVADAAASLAVLAGPDPRDDAAVDGVWRDYIAAAARPQHLLRGCRVAWSDDLGFAAVDPEVRDVFRTTVSRLEAIGIPLSESHPRAGNPTTLWTDVAVCEGFAALGHLLPLWEEEMWPGVPEIIRAGNRSAAEYLDALQRRSAYTRVWSEFFMDFDLLLTPMMQVPPFEIGVRGPSEIDGQPVDPFFDDWSNLCYPASLTGQPAASVPVGFTSGRLPAAVQVIGPRFRDDLVLGFSAAIEEVVGFPVASIGRSPKGEQVTDH